MTALADIRKAAAVMYGDRLRGSDLTEFNEAHPRDEGGRFASQSGTSPQFVDPRMERQARRGRRVRRALKAVAAQQQAAPVVAEEDPRSLADLRMARDRGLKRNLTRQPVRQQAKPKEGKAAETDLNDRSFLKEEEAANPFTEETYLLLDPDKAVQVLLDQSFIVGAANQKWDADLHVFTTDELRAHAKDNDISGKVALRIKPTESGVLISEQSSQPRAMKLAGDQYIAVDQRGGKRIEDHKGKTTLTNAKGETFKIPRIEVGAYNRFEAGIWLQDYPNVNKSVATSKALEEWDEEEHPRDMRSGRFTQVGAPSGSQIDPRIARNRRRRRRGARALASIATTAQPTQAPARNLERDLTRRLPRVLPMSHQAQLRARRDAQVLMPDMPKDAEIVFTAEIDDPLYDDEAPEHGWQESRDTDPNVLTTVGRRVEHYERHVYPEIRRNLASADSLIQRAASGKINQQDEVDITDRVMFSRKFLSGQRTESQYADAITDEDVAQSIRQLQSAKRMFDAMQKQGAGQWHVKVEPSIEGEVKEATHVSLNEADIAALTGFAPEVRSSGFGAKIVTIGDYRQMQQVKSDREAATKMVSTLASLRSSKNEADNVAYEMVVVPHLLRFSSGAASWDEVMSDIAHRIGDEGAQRHYERAHDLKVAEAAKTAEVKAAAKVLSAEQQARNAVVQAKMKASVAGTAVADTEETAALSRLRSAPRRVTTTSGREVLLSGGDVYDLLGNEEAPDPRVRTKATYDPIEFDDDGRPIIPDPDTPREFVHPKLRRAFDLQNRALRSGKGRLAPS